MEQTRICLTLTGKTLAENLATLNKYRSFIDLVELRADFLESDERLRVREFPRLAGLPCILTLRRRVDGGEFIEGEAARTILFARALSFADEDKSKNFEYVDFEEDFRIPSLQDAALAFGTKIIRSVHYMAEPVKNIASRLEQLRTTGYEIPKIAFMPQSLDDVSALFSEAAKLKSNNHILVAMGPLGVPSRILAAKLKNYLTYTSAIETAENTAKLSHLDPLVLHNTYQFKKLNEETELFGITGWPLSKTASPKLHNEGYVRHGINAVYIPIRAQKIDEVFTFAKTVGVKGFSVTIPYKELVMDKLVAVEEKAADIGACNTVVLKDDGWHGFNTDASGFMKALLEFTGTKNLAHKKISIIGAGGAARAVAYVVKKLKGKACVFNRTISKAKSLASLYGFSYALLNFDSISILKKHSDIIIQTTSKGMNCQPPSNDENDPLYFYDFMGTEMVFDIVYTPEVTPIMARAAEAGCRVCNGYGMLKYQGYDQFELFTGKSYTD